MYEQLRTSIHQAQLHMQQGNSQRALELLENARVLARGDKRALLEVLPDLISCYYDVGKEDQARQFEEQLSYLQGGEFEMPVDLAPAKRVEPAAAPRSMGAFLWAGLAVALVIIGVGGYLVSSWADATYSRTAKDVTDGIALVVQFGRYGGVVDGRNVVVEVPLRCGTCFAVHKNGVMLAPEMLDEENLPDAPLARFPELHLTSSSINVYFCSDSSRPVKAKVSRELPRSGLVLLDVDRHMTTWLRVSENQIDEDEKVEAMEFIGGPWGLLDAHDVDSIEAKVESGLLDGDRVVASDWIKSSGQRGKASRAEVSDVGGNIVVDVSGARASGRVGAPLLNEFDNVVGVIVPCSKPGAENGSDCVIVSTDFRKELEEALSAL